MPKSIFLNENRDYCPCAHFGYNTDENDELLKDILRQVKEDKLFKDYGLIRYQTFSRKLAKRYTEEVDDKIKYIEPYCNQFITCNPMIVENLKMYL
jgi:hypothetical protein